MPNITIHKPADVEIVVIDGEPPADQSALIASLQAEVATLTESRDELQARFDALNAAIDEAQGQA